MARLVIEQVTVGAFERALRPDEDRSFVIPDDAQIVQVEGWGHATIVYFTRPASMDGERNAR